MEQSGLLDLLPLTSEFRSLHQTLEQGKAQVVYGLGGAFKGYLVAAVSQVMHRPCLLVTADVLMAERMAEDLSAWLGLNKVALFPPVDILPYDVVAYGPEFTSQRLQVLARLLRGEALTVVVPVDALMVGLTPPEIWSQFCLTLKEGQTVNLEGMSRALVDAGYERVGLVESKGQFSIRGGILDVFSMTWEKPRRVEFFGDEIDSIREFDPLTQRSLRRVQEAHVVPARERVVPPEYLDSGLSALEAEARAMSARLADKGFVKAAENLRQRVAGHVEKLREGALELVENYAPYFFPRLSTLMDYCPVEPVVMVDEIGRVQKAAETLEEKNRNRYLESFEAGKSLPRQHENYLAFEEVTARWQGNPLVHLSAFLKQVPEKRLARVLCFETQQVPFFAGQWDLLGSEIKRWKGEQYRVVFFVATDERARRLVEMLRDRGLEASFLPAVRRPPQKGEIVVTVGSLQEGFRLAAQKLMVLSEAQVFPKPRQKRRLRTQAKARRMLVLHDLKPGDYVVHTNHGIGVYRGVKTLEVGGVRKDYLHLEYAAGDRVYVPTDQMDMVQKYIGVEGEKPKLSRLGGNEWARTKKQVKESVREIARELLQLYAVRQTIRGHKFAPDSPWQREFEEAFPYEETPDQLQATEEIKGDMEKPTPMDRLLCGDVGYGKTEVAIRAAFKAVMDGKQVAMLVPTTILAQQHYHTFRERFASYPVNIGLLSRFRSKAEQAETVKKLRQGEVDIVIGTHRLIQDDVVFRDLGLLIIDEEQRFGVTQKERLKKLRQAVDVLTLSATPIPRTLHMALVGMRDMSVIESPPEDRFPVQTYVVEYSRELVRDAITREMARGGQVYYVHNRVQTIDAVAARVQEIVPEARVAVAHGQMKEEQLENIMAEFLEGEYDVLVCTTIIESGLDIANVNTLIVEEAERFGLAQLYQLRGRVGRSNRLAYAYFTYRPDQILSEVAEKRLQAIREFTEFGSGFKIAMRDLEIRGAGNILGPEQHGFIVSVGFDLYCRLLEDAVREMKGETTPSLPEPSIDLVVDAYLDDSYIPDGGQKIEAYKKVAAVKNLDDVMDLRQELEDRFGPLPREAGNLLTVARIKILARQTGLQSIAQKKYEVVLRFMEGIVIPNRLSSVLQRRYHRRIVVLPGKRPMIKLRVRDLRHSLEPQEVLETVENLLGDIVELGGRSKSKSRLFNGKK